MAAWLASGLVSALGAPSCAVAQWRVEITDCEGAPMVREGLTAALEVELDGSSDPDPAAAIRIEFDCSEESAVVSLVEDRDGAGDAAQVLVQAQVALDSTLPHLRDRLLAMVARELAVAARGIAEETRAGGVTIEPPDAPAPPVAERAAVFDEPAVGAAGEAIDAPQDPEPADGEPPAESVTPAVPPAPLVELQLLGGARAFVLDAPAVLGGGQLGWRWDWLAGTLSVEGGSQRTRYATIDSFVAAVAVGVVPLVARGGALYASLGLFVEGGIAVTSAASRVSGFTGTTELSPLIGGLARLTGGWWAHPSVLVIAALDAGYHYGVEVVTLGENVLSLNGLSLGLRLGISVAP